jgi:bifunctional N-acetylglucosamine-1-phosphate-uridyltransferase/glucosamine-1-phosphate-acetyltransferase GlmU-like protein
MKILHSKKGELTALPQLKRIRMKKFSNDYTNRIEKLEAEKKALLEALKESVLQIEYFQQRLNTGTGNAMLSKLDGIISKVEGKP